MDINISLKTDFSISIQIYFHNLAVINDEQDERFHQSLQSTKEMESTNNWNISRTKNVNHLRLDFDPAKDIFCTIRHERVLSLPQSSRG